MNPKNNIKIKEIHKNIYLLTFKNQYEITSTLLRFQEHYESPKFRHKVFTLKEYKKWYTKQKGTTKFTYYKDWNGFNFPSSNLKAFFENKFNPLSKKEKEILKKFKNINKKTSKYYIIGVHEESKFAKKLLRHEIAHALYYLDKNYRKEILKILKKTKKEKIEKIEKKLRESGGYCEEVLNDEIQAYSQNYFNKFTKNNFLLSFKIRKLFKKHLKKYNQKQ